MFETLSYNDNDTHRISMKKRREIANKYSLTHIHDVKRVFLTSTQRDELIINILYTDSYSFIAISKSNFFYLTLDKNYSFSLYCSQVKPTFNPIYTDMFKCNFYKKVYITEPCLIRYLDKLEPLRVV